MRSAVTRLVLGAVLSASASVLAAPPSVFDAPRSTKVVKLPASSSEKATLTCNYYPRFMVKQIDAGEVGASQLSIVPASGPSTPACQRKNVPTEKVVSTDDWGGYFKGVKGDYVFFDAEDGVNGAMGFAVFDPAAKKLFEDSASGDIRGATSDGDGLAILYRRSVAADCSVVKGGASCWAKIAATLGLPEAPSPDCAGGYRKAKDEMAKGRCEADEDKSPSCVAKKLEELDRQRWDESPSVITYEARTVIASDRATTTALGPALTCHPAD